MDKKVSDLIIAHEKELSKNNTKELLRHATHMVGYQRSQLFNFFAKNKIDLLKYTDEIPGHLFEGLMLEDEYDSGFDVFKKEFTVPSHITVVGSRAFYQNRTYQHLIIPPHVVYVGANLCNFSDISRLSILSKHQIINLRDLISLEVIILNEEDTIDLVIDNELPFLKEWLVPSVSNEKHLNFFEEKMKAGLLPSLKRLVFTDRTYDRDFAQNILYPTYCI